MDAAFRQPVDVMTPEATNRLAGDLADKFVADASVSLWWTALRTAPVTLEYAPGDEFAWLEEHIGGDHPVSLLVTNEEPVPEGGIVGRLSAVLEVLKDSIGFEYVLLPGSLAWVLFDTHHNEFVYVGRLPKEQE